MKVKLVDGDFVLVDQVTEAEDQGGELKEIYKDGKFNNTLNLDEVRTRVNQLV